MVSLGGAPLGGDGAQLNKCEQLEGEGADYSNVAPPPEADEINSGRDPHFVCTACGYSTE